MFANLIDLGTVSLVRMISKEFFLKYIILTQQSLILIFLYQLIFEKEKHEF